MTDFIDVLEQQLVAAHRRPERRRFVVVPWRATIVFASAAAAAAVVVVPLRTARLTRGCGVTGVVCGGCVGGLLAAG